MLIEDYEKDLGTKEVHIQRSLSSDERDVLNNLYVKLIMPKSNKKKIPIKENMTAEEIDEAFVNMLVDVKKKE